MIGLLLGDSCKPAESRYAIMRRAGLELATSGSRVIRRAVPLTTARTHVTVFLYFVSDQIIMIDALAFAVILGIFRSVHM